MLYRTGLAIVISTVGLLHAATQITINSTSYSGKDAVWTLRDPGYMGIRGSHSVESGNIWFEKFSGPTGKYKVTWNASADDDGRSPYKITAGSTTIASGELPLGTRSGLDPRAVNLGSGHQISNGVKINVWGKSAYDNPKDPTSGAYCRWKSLVFILEATTSLNPSPVKKEHFRIAEKRLTGFYTLRGSYATSSVRAAKTSCRILSIDDHGRHGYITTVR